MSDASSPLADGFDSVAVGIEDIGRVIVVMIALAEAGSAIVRSAIGKCCGMKRIDCCPSSAVKARWIGSLSPLFW
jgi:hypothetical protein